MFFADITTSDVATIITALFIGVGALLAAFFTFATKIMNAARTERAEERRAFTNTLDKVAKSSNRVAEATEKGAKEAKERNGHLAELIIESKDATTTALSALNANIGHQDVKEQYVDKQVVQK